MATYKTGSRPGRSGIFKYYGHRDVRLMNGGERRGDRTSSPDGRCVCKIEGNYSVPATTIDPRLPRRGHARVARDLVNWWTCVHRMNSREDHRGRRDWGRPPGGRPYPRRQEHPPGRAPTRRLFQARPGLARILHRMPVTISPNSDRLLPNRRTIGAIPVCPEYLLGVGEARTTMGAGRNGANWSVRRLRRRTDRCPRRAWKCRMNGIADFWIAD